jgi:thioredoxin reductase (NADPH)
LTAGIYPARADIDTLIIDTTLLGCYVAITHWISRYPGSIDPQNGYQLSNQMTEQAKLVFPG